MSSSHPSIHRHSVVTTTSIRIIAVSIELRFLLNKQYLPKMENKSRSTSRSSTRPLLLAAQFPGDALWDPSWKTSFGEATIRAHQQPPQEPHARTFYCSWFCPFAQRAWIALEECKLPYHYVEVNPYHVDPSQPGGYSKQALTLAAKRQSMPDFIQVTSKHGLQG